ncbi:hypothetical protein TH66_21945 [Carbonactinospora thermoautotrophica]|uniref:ABC transporter permease n=3 Tax=Carbonactinospora thermoautotrophica TaxID=1469144 RepID=A0A132MYT7_9ACTN|nr:FtsX-like permease family protein [Carbonactinospora thermoautotrophica]KWW97997.1 hypothetical protein TH66_21945 [Carbonactinospora thermoautotrophica]KWX03075.1 hypothetical protein LI90_4125 [Carbonactinospora thermoautotrophica]
MLRTTLAGLRGHARRFILPAIAIMLGVAFVAGTLVLSDSMQATFRKAFLEQGRIGDVAVSGDRGELLTPADLEKVRAVAGVAAAEPRYNSFEYFLIGKNGRVVESDFGASQSIAMPLASVPELQEFKLVKGAYAAKDDEVVIDARSAERAGYRIGDQVRITDSKQRTATYRLVGLIDPGYNYQAAAGNLIGFAPATARKLLKPRGYHQIDVLAAPGVPQEELKKRLASALPKAQVQTTEALVRQEADENAEELRAFTQGLLLFALLALVVAGVVIYNTFAILIAQRVRELALLRLVGSTRGQVFRGVLVESLVIGLVASLVGLAGGFGLAAGIWALLGAIAAVPMPELSLSLSPVTVAASLGIGVLVTLLSAVVPARRATKVPPIAALRTQVEGPVSARAGAVRVGFGLLLALGGAALVALGVQQPSTMVAASGCGLLFFAVMALGPLFVGPLSRMLGLPLAAVFRTTGKLAIANSRRNPKRVAATTLALTLGVMLVTMFATVFDSAKEASATELDKRFPTDYVLAHQRHGQPLPVSLADQVRSQPQVAQVSEVHTAIARVSDERLAVAAYGEGALGELVDLPMTQGTESNLRPGGAIVALDDRHAYQVGQRIRLTAVERDLDRRSDPRQTAPAVRTGKTITVEVLGTFDRKRFRDLPGVIITERDFRAMFGATGPTELLVQLKDGVAAKDGRAAMERATAGHPLVRIQGQAQMKDQIGKALDQLLMFVVGLVGLALVIALVGIANTMSLSVLERTRESALLRALGLTKGQLRTMLLAESVLMALIGALLGTGLGLVFAWAAIRSTVPESMQLFAVPVDRLAVTVGLTALAGVIAALLPARRATKASVVAALTD